MQEKTPQEKAAAEKQVELLVNALERAKQNGGVWMNPTGKAAPRFYPKGVTVSPFNSLSLSLHSDQNNYKTNEYTLFSEAKKRGESVQSKEKGVPFNWYSWNEYVNKHDAEDKISKEDYKSLDPEQRAAYKGVRTREIRTLFNIDQTTLPFVDKEGYEGEVKAFGAADVRETAEAGSERVQAAINDFIDKAKENLVPIHLDGSGIAHYDAKKDAVYLPSASSYNSVYDYANDAVREVVASTGHPQRLAREGMGDGASEDALKQERLIAEIATGVKLLEMGMPATLSPDSMKMIDYWQRELQENPCLIDIVETDVNNAVEMMHKAERGEKVTKSGNRSTRVANTNEPPKHYFIAEEIKGLPNKETKEVVIVRDNSTKMADVVLPAGASLGMSDDIAGMNKGRIESALKKEGFETVTFYNVDGAHGYRPDDSFFKDKDVAVAKLNGWNLNETAKLDVSDAVKRADSMSFDKVLMMKDDEGKWSLFLKPENEKSFIIYPSKEDVNRFFVTMKQGHDENTDAMRLDMAQKYYLIAGQHPELKNDPFKSQATAEELAKIDRVNIFKTKQTEDKPSVILCMPTVQGEKLKPREVTQQQWQRMWLADDKQDYKMHLAATLFADVLREGRSETKAVEEQKPEREDKNKLPTIPKEFAEDKECVRLMSEIQQLEKKTRAETMPNRQRAMFNELKGLKGKLEEHIKMLEEQQKGGQKVEETKKPELSPMLKQFMDLKKKHPDALLLFRCGDFYETYMEDAEKASKILGITLTKSSKSKDPDGKPLAMAGFPYHALDTYLPKLIRAGQRVAICDQIEAPKQAPKRGITELAEPGTGMEKQPKQEAGNEKPQNQSFHR